MGNEPQLKKYRIPVNKKLNEIISAKIKSENNKIDSLIKKNIKKIKTCNFSNQFNQNGIKNISSLINLIYMKNANSCLKIQSNRTIYETVFHNDYNGINKIENLMNNYEKKNDLEKNTSESLNEENNNISKDRIENDMESNENKNGLEKYTRESLNEEKNNISNQRIENDMESNENNNDNEKNIMKSLNKVNNDISKNRIKNDMEINKNNNENEKNTMKSLNKVNNNISKKRIKNDMEINKNNNENEKNTMKSLNKDNNNNNGKKKKHNKCPKNPPVAIIKFDLSELYKQDLMEKQILRGGGINKKITNISQKKIYDQIENLTKEGIRPTNLNDGSFLEIINYLAKDN